MLRSCFALTAGVVVLSLITSGGAAAATPDVSPDAKAVEPFRLMSKEREAAFRSRLPKVADKAIQAKLDDPSLILYTDKEINKINELEQQTIKALSVVNKIIRAKLDDFVGSIIYK